MGELDQEGQAIRIVRGGKGGKGNISVKIFKIKGFLGQRFIRKSARLRRREEGTRVAPQNDC
jgi:hypothetical protein